MHDNIDSRGVVEDITVSRFVPESGAPQYPAIRTPIERKGILCLNNSMGQRRGSLGTPKLSVHARMVRRGHRRRKRAGSQGGGGITDLACRVRGNSFEFVSV